MNTPEANDKRQERVNQYANLIVTELAKRGIKAEYDPNKGVYGLGMMKVEPNVSAVFIQQCPRYGYLPNGHVDFKVSTSTYFGRWHGDGARSVTYKEYDNGLNVAKIVDKIEEFQKRELYHEARQKALAEQREKLKTLENEGYRFLREAGYDATLLRELGFESTIYQETNGGEFSVKLSRRISLDKLLQILALLK